MYVRSDTNGNIKPLVAFMLTKSFEPMSKQIYMNYRKKQLKNVEMLFEFGDRDNAEYNREEVNSFINSYYPKEFATAENGCEWWQD